MTTRREWFRSGSRFSLYGSEFEIQHVDQDSMRYAACKGGKQNTGDISAFVSFANQGALTFTYVAFARSPGDVSAVTMSSSEHDFAERVRAYVLGLKDRFGWSWNQALATKVIREIADARKESAPGYSTVARWRRVAIRIGMNVDQLAGGFSKRGRKAKFSHDAVTSMKATIKNLHDSDARLNGVTIKDQLIGELAANNRLKEMFPRGVPSVRTVQRAIRKLDPHSSYRARHGAAAARRVFKAAGASELTGRILDVVQADGHIIDLEVLPDLAEGINAASGVYEPLGSLRPYLTVITDVHSRYPLAMEITFAPFSANTTLRCLRTAVCADGDWARGVPRKMVLDNGADYISDGLKRATSNLHIGIEYAQPGDPNKKAIIERFFGRFADFIHTLPGSTGSNPADKGDYDSKGKALLTISDLRRRAKEWLTIYRDEIHGGTGRTPAGMWKAGLEDAPPQVMAPEQMDAIARVPHQKTITGGRVNLFAGLSWYSHLLADYEYEKRSAKQDPLVWVFVDESDLTHVYVQLERKDRVLVKADPTKRLYQTGLSLFEHELLKQQVREAGDRDVAQLADYELEKRKYLLRKGLAEDAQRNQKVLRRLRRVSESHSRRKPAKQAAIERLDDLPKEVAPAPSSALMAPPSPVIPKEEPIELFPTFTTQFKEVPHAN